MPAPSSFDAERALALARATLDIEARALDALKERQGDGFVAALGAILACRGRVVVMGMGKSGHVGRKVAATLASTGTPAFFVHPGEASHGDLGMVTAGDVVLAISNSGESDEIAAIVPAIKRLGVTLDRDDRPASRAASAAMPTIVVSSAVDQEACPLNLAPTASTTAQMALGDALAVALLDARGFREEDFARSHPGGSLGRKLLMHVVDLMRSGDAVPRVDAGTVMTEMLHEMTRKGLGFTAVCDAERPGRRHLHRRRPAPPDRDRRRSARDARQRRHERLAQAGSRRRARGRGRRSDGAPSRHRPARRRRAPASWSARSTRTT